MGQSGIGWCRQQPCQFFVPKNWNLKTRGSAYGPNPEEKRAHFFFHLSFSTSSRCFHTSWWSRGSLCVLLLARTCGRNQKCLIGSLPSSLSNQQQLVISFWAYKVLFCFSGWCRPVQQPASIQISWVMGRFPFRFPTLIGGRREAAAVLFQLVTLSRSSWRSALFFSPLSPFFLFLILLQKEARSNGRTKKRTLVEKATSFFLLRVGCWLESNGENQVFSCRACRLVHVH